MDAEKWADAEVSACGSSLLIISLREEEQARSSESDGRGAGVFQGLNSHLKCPKRGHPFHLAILFLLCKFSRKHLSYFVELSSHSFEIFILEF